MEVRFQETCLFLRFPLRRLEYAITGACLNGFSAALRSSSKKPKMRQSFNSSSAAHFLLRAHQLTATNFDELPREAFLLCWFLHDGGVEPPGWAPVDAPSCVAGVEPPGPDPGVVVPAALGALGFMDEICGFAPGKTPPEPPPLSPKLFAIAAPFAVIAL